MEIVNYLVEFSPFETRVMSSPVMELAKVAPEYMIPIMKESLMGNVCLQPHSMVIGTDGMMKKPMIFYWVIEYEGGDANQNVVR
jgi:hypothetical protein